MLCVAIVEDEQAYREQIEQYIQRYAKEHDVEFRIKSYSDGKDIIEDYKPVYDIILLDIMMPSVNGMKAAEKIRAADEQVVLMFITQMAQYAIQGYSVGALDFVLKPIDYESFQMRFSRAVERAQSREGGKIILTLPSGMIKIRTKDIYYVEIQNHVLHYYTVHGEYSVRGTMQEAEKTLLPYSFAKCNHWYLVNLAHVSEVDKNIAVVGESRLEISRRNRPAFMEAVTNYMGGNT